MSERELDVFVGRGDELSLVRACVGEVEQGRPWVIVVSGAAGCGKSALVRESVASLVGFGVVRAAADALAVDESMYLISQLISAPSQETPFGVGLELLAMLGERQSEGPVALVVEDLHWADDDSRRALLTALRRLEGDRVLAFVTTRPDWRGDDAWDRLIADRERCQLLELGALSSADVSAIADRLDVPLGPNAAIRLHRHTDGHALYVRTLLRELTPVELNAFGTLPAPRSLASATVTRVAALPTDSIELVRALAVLGRASRLAVLGSMAGVADASWALEGALASGFVDWEPTAPGLMVRFAHPLYAAAVYDDIPPVRRRQLHLAAADVDDAAALLHRIAAADRADPALAGELDEAAFAASDPALAARYLSAAADLSASPAEEASRLLAAARRHRVSGNVRALAQLQSRLEGCPPSTERDVLLGWLAWQEGDTGRAESVLRSAAHRAPEARQAARALMQLGSMYAFQSRGREAIEVGRAVLALDDLERHNEELAWQVIAGGTNSSEGGVAARAVLDGRYGHDVDATDLHPTVRWLYALFENSAGRPTSAIAWFDRLMPDIRRGAMPGRLPHLHMIRALCHYQVGAWDDAMLHANTAVDLANDEAQTWVLGHVNGIAACVHAGRGQWELAERRLHHARVAAGVASNPLVVLTAAVAGGFLARARRRPADVVAALSPLTAPDGTTVPPASSLHFWAALVHAMIDLGDIDKAQRELAKMRDAAADRQLDLRMQLSTLEARLLAASGSVTAASAAFEAAIASIGVDSDVVEQIVLLHTFGRHLRASGRRRDAIVQLSAAHAMASKLGAAPYAERIDVDLRGSEATSVTPAADDPLSTLTSRERDVVTLIAHGATNREAASSLYVSVKTVEYHLGNIYAKLHITSRRQLKELIEAA